MKAMILAAGRGTRMGKLTENTPKPLLPVSAEKDSKRLIEFHIERLVAAGYDEIVINRAQHADQFDQVLGNGARYGARIHYSDEGDAPLETGGGIYKALPQLDDTSFLVINGDVWCDVDLTQLPHEPQGLAHLVLVKNPEHHPDGDFALIRDRVRLLSPEDPMGGDKLTFSGVAIYRPELFDECSAGSFPLAPLLRHAISQDLVAGQLHTGAWMDIGTPERLEQLEKSLALSLA